MITEEIKRRLHEEFEAARKQELSDKMRARGKVRSPAKTRAVRKNAKKALAARMKKLKGKK